MTRMPGWGHLSQGNSRGPRLPPVIAFGQGNGAPQCWICRETLLRARKSACRDFRTSIQLGLCLPRKNSPLLGKIQGACGMGMHSPFSLCSSDGLPLFTESYCGSQDWPWPPFYCYLGEFSLWSPLRPPTQKVPDPTGLSSRNFIRSELFLIS